MTLSYFKTTVKSRLKHLQFVTVVQFNQVRLFSRDYCIAKTERFFQKRNVVEHLNKYFKIFIRSQVSIIRTGRPVSSGTMVHIGSGHIGFYLFYFF